MSDYIKRQQVFDALPILEKDKQISLYGAVADFIVLVSKIPAADVAPVEHGRWLQIMNGVGVCSNCYKLDEVDPIATNCRFCGARMDG